MAGGIICWTTDTCTGEELVAWSQNLIPDDGTLSCGFVPKPFNEISGFQIKQDPILIFWRNAVATSK